jgi:hypothetical protein
MPNNETLSASKIFREVCTIGPLPSQRWSVGSAQSEPATKIERKFVMRNSIAMLVMALLVAAPASQASAGAIKVGGDARLTANIDGNQINTAVGTDITTGNFNSGIYGQVEVGGDVNATTRVNGDQIVVAVGTDICAINSNATMSSYAPCR